MPDTKQSGLSENSIGAVAYITVVPAIFFLAISPYNKSAYVRYHAWQSTTLSAVAFILCLVLSLIPALHTYFEFIALLSLYAVILLAWILVSIWCAVFALNGKRTKLPLLGAWAEQQSKK